MSKKLLLTSLLISLASCGNAEDRNKYFAEAVGETKATAYSKEFYKPYLDCYALDVDSKKQCLNKLSGVFKYDVKDNKDYVRGFIHECERRGFQYFLNDQNLPCEKIDEGAVFDQKKEAYLVQCSSGENYYMQFDYKGKIWNIQN